MVTRGYRNHSAYTAAPTPLRVISACSEVGTAEKSRQKDELARRREMRESTSSGSARAETAQMLIYSPGGVVRRCKSRKLAGGTSLTADRRASAFHAPFFARPS